MSQILIIGGSDAGISAALRAKEISPQTEVTIVMADEYPAFSICGLPFFLSGEIPDWRRLAHHDLAEFEALGVKLLLKRRAEIILPHTKKVRTISADGQTEELAYDKLLIATGAESGRPPIEGLDQAGVFFLRYMADGLAMNRFIESEKPSSAIIIGGGYIGLEMADSLTRRGLTVTVLEFAPEILTTMDAEMGRQIRTELLAKGVKVFTGKAVRSVERKGNILMVSAATGETWSADLALVAGGVKPATQLAASASLALGAGGAIRVDQSMATSATDIMAAGDCAETWHHLLKSAVYMPLGSTAHKQGRAAGENMAGGKCEFKGTLGTQAVKVFERVAAGSGLRDASARKAGFDPLTITLTSTDRNPYYPGAREMTVCVTGERKSGRLLGGQIVGNTDSEISKRIDILASALFNGLLVEDLLDLDLSYSPPLSTPWDPIQKAAMQWAAEVRRSS